KASAKGISAESPTIHRPGGLASTSWVSKSLRGHIGKARTLRELRELSAAGTISASRTFQHTRKPWRISNGNTFQVPSFLKERGQRMTRAGSSRQLGADHADIVGSGDPDLDDAPPGLNHLDHDILTDLNHFRTLPCEDQHIHPPECCRTRPAAGRIR